MTSSTATITIRFLDWWHAGTGQSGEGDADMIAHRDSFGCPAMPMTQIKGILRETAEKLGVLTENEVVEFFGEKSVPVVTVDAKGSGIAFTGDAMLTPEERAWFGHATNHGARGQLFGWLSSTAINEKTGAAKRDSLRSIETCVPVTLSQKIDWIRGNPPQGWIDKLDQLCALSPAFGKHAHDGLGRAIACCVAVKESAA